MANEFKFLDPGKLVDHELELILSETNPENVEKKYVPAYKFDLYNTATKEKMGYIHLRIGQNENIFYGGNIGYGVDEKYRGHHFAARSCKLLFDLARRHGLSEVWITCNVGNFASRRSAELAGFKLIEIVDLPEHNEMYEKGERQKCRYKIDL